MKRTALSANFVDVDNAINGGGPFVGPAQNDDIIIIPGGTVHWGVGQQLNVTAAITIQGDPSGSTVIINDLTGKSLMVFHGVNANSITRLTQLGITNGGSQNAGGIAGGCVLRFVGIDPSSGWRIRVDHNRFDSLKQFPIYVSDVYGVVDHNEFINSQGVGYSYNLNFGGHSFGDGSWASPTDYATPHMIYYEDNKIEVAAHNGWDGTRGGRVCVRHNTITMLATDTQSVFGCHGLENRMRSIRHAEFYNNYIVKQNSRSTVHHRGGTFIGFNNRVELAVGGQTPAFHFQFDRGGDSNQSWGRASGSNPFDLNDTTGGITTYTDGHGTINFTGSNSDPKPFEVGTTTTAGTNQVIDNSKGWTPGEWIGYSVTDIDQLDPTPGAGSNSGEVQRIGGVIVGNTDKVLSIGGFVFDTSPRHFPAGNRYKILRVAYAIDSTGRAGNNNPGSLMGGGDGTNTPPKPPNPPFPAANGGLAQDYEPCFEWNNVYIPGGDIDFNSDAILKGVTVNGYGAHYKSDTIATIANGCPVNYPWNGVTVSKCGAQYAGATNVDVTGTGGYTYPHPMTAGVATPLITSANSVSFTEGVGGTFQVTVSGFTSTPTYGKTGSFPATGSTFSSGGLLTVGASSAAGVYNFTITATNGGEVDTQSFTLTITAAPTKVIAISGTLAFGDHDINTTATQDVTIINNGNTTLTVTGITLPSGYSASWTSGTIAPGASHLVVVTFAPTAAIAYNGTVTVASDKTSGTNTLAASGTGVTRVMGLSGNLAFGNITTGQTATRQLTINNTGNRALAISAINYPQGFSGDFASASIAAGGSKILNVTFAPIAAQLYSGSIDIVSDKTSGTSTVAASGTGTASATKIIQLTGDLAFGNVQTGTSVQRVLTLTNSGNSLLTVSAVSFPTGFSGDWTSGTIAAGGHQDINVTFSPITATSYGGTVTATSDASGGINTTSASGTGVAPATKVIGLSGNLAFGAVLIGTSPTRTLIIANTGSAPLNVSGITYPSGFTGAFSGAIAPGASQNVTVTFSPLAVQSYNGTITVASDATGGTNTVVVTGSGAAPTTRVIALTGNLAFGNVQKNHTTQRILTIANNGTAALAVSNITLPSGFSANWTSGSIAAGATQSVTITFAPTAAQNYSGTVTVVSNKTAGANTMACSGTGKEKKQVPFFLIVG